MKLYAFCLLLALSGCKKYLDEKPDKKLQLPTTVEAVQGLLDSDNIISLQNPGTGEISADNYYTLDATFNALISDAVRNTYLWADDITLNEYSNHWSRLYDIVTIANVCLESLDKIDHSAANDAAWSNAKGSALVFRAKSFLTIIGYWTKAYSKNSAATDMGIPLRLSSDYNIVTTRASLQESYDRVLSDLKEAVSLLPAIPRHVMRPSAGAAFGLLARTYLQMNEYDSALSYTGKCLAINSTLLNYNTISQTITFPFSAYNTEVIMHSTIFLPSILTITRHLIDSNLYRSYEANDLRRILFFKSNGNGTYYFQGNYNPTGPFFNGVATDEIYLIKSECLARQGKISEAMAALNSLLITRWKTGTFVPFTAATTLAALKIILAERRKELLFRDLRWMDLKRLNLEMDFQVTLYRKMNGKDYVLPPNDNRYALPIPTSVIAMSGIAQNPR